jgi:hypothetical protein
VLVSGRFRQQKHRASDENRFALELGELLRVDLAGDVRLDLRRVEANDLAGNLDLLRVLERLERGLIGRVDDQKPAREDESMLADQLGNLRDDRVNRLDTVRTYALAYGVC